MRRWGSQATRSAGAVLALAAASALPACGGEAGDLLALEVAGGTQDEPVRLTITEDGRGACDIGELGMPDSLESIPSERLIEARELERDLEGLAADGSSFTDPAASSGDRRRYVARTRAGTVRWVEGAPDLPEVLPRAALLAEQLEDDLCER